LLEYGKKKSVTGKGGKSKLELLLGYWQIGWGKAQNPPVSRIRGGRTLWFI